MGDLIYLVCIKSQRMLNIRTLAPDLSEDAIETFRSRERMNWILLSRIWEQKLFGGKELNAHDLCQGVPRDKTGLLRAAVPELVNEGILTAVPKPGEPVYRANSSHKVFKHDPSIEVMVEIRTNKPLKKAMIAGPLEVPEIHPDILKVLDIYLSKAVSRNPQTLESYDIKCGAQKTTKLEGDYYTAEVIYHFICPITHKSIVLKLVVDSPNLWDLVSVDCQNCGFVHYVNRAGVIR